MWISYGPADHTSGLYLDASTGYLGRWSRYNEGSGDELDTPTTYLEDVADMLEAPDLAARDRLGLVGGALVWGSRLDPAREDRWRLLARAVIPERPHPCGASMTRMKNENAAPARFKDLALDAVDHQALADWWCAALGYERSVMADGSARPQHWPVPIVDKTGSGPLIWINPVSERKTFKNRMHLDVWGVPDRLVAMGATVVRAPGQRIDWHVMADPEGNEFCVFTDPDDTP
ncbi:VOC family protein [Streptomyces sp. NPDC057325]|uniref:VOC family protein n=1 Tax=unclassified Streptomyces TaxID=2593676 RepID=UPI0036407CA7